MSSLPQLYQPTTTEITAAAVSAAHRHPRLAGRIGKAADILTGGIQLEPVAWELRNVVHWRIASQSHNGAYIVVGMSCPCKDSHCNGVSHCKHAAAVGLYTKILNNKFNADVRAGLIDLGIQPDGTFNAYPGNSRRGMGIVHVHKLASVYVFCDPASMVRYAIWAAKQPIAVEWPTSVAVAA